jgi:hypothetical protein
VIGSGCTRYGKDAAGIEAVAKRVRQHGIASVKGLKVYAAAGKDVWKGDALTALAGGVVGVSEDGKLVNPAFLAKYRQGTLALVAPELVL